MKKFEILEHKADLKIRAFGKDLRKLFLNVMIGMFEGARYEEEVKGKKSKVKIKLKSIDLPSLLVDFLGEILYFAETKKEVYQKVDFKKFSETEIEATLIGKKLKKMGVQIKAVTYHNLDIHQREDGAWEATVLFDI